MSRVAGMAWLDRLSAHLRSPQGGYDAHAAARLGTSRLRTLGPDKPRWMGYLNWIVALVICLGLAYVASMYGDDLRRIGDRSEPYWLFVIVGVGGIPISVWGLWSVWAGRRVGLPRR